MSRIFGKPEQPSYRAEFVRGPYDGLEVVCAALADAVAMPVSPNRLRCMTGDFSGEPSPISSLALYRLFRTDTQNRYEYFGSLSAKRLHLEKWTL